MDTRAVWVLFAALAACSGTSQLGLSAPSAPAPAQISPAEVVEQPPLSEEEQAFVARLEPFIEAAARGAKRCHGLIDPITSEAIRAQGLPFDAVGLDEACGEVGALYDDSVREGADHDRVTDVLFGHVARVADDLDYLRRAMQDSTSERVRAHQHVRDALAEIDAALVEWRGQTPISYGRDALRPDPQKWRRDLGIDHHDLTSLRSHFGHLAFDQGVDPTMVRRRMLESFLRVASHPAGARLVALQGEADPVERTHRQAYLDATTKLLTVYRDILQAFVQGRVPDRAAHRARVAEADRALAEWTSAWELETARLQ